MSMKNKHRRKRKNQSKRQSFRGSHTNYRKNQLTLQKNTNMKEEKIWVNNTLNKLELSNKPTVVVSEKLLSQINFLHNKEGNKEWSGELITSEEGKITDLDSWRIICEEMFLADIGNGGSTEYEVDKGGFKSVDIVEMYELFPGLLDGTKKAHHIHTHCLNGAFEK